MSWNHSTLAVLRWHFSAPEILALLVAAAIAWLVERVGPGEEETLRSSRRPIGFFEAANLLSESREAPFATGTRSIVGTLAYMAPEQAEAGNSDPNAVGILCPNCGHAHFEDDEWVPISHGACAPASEAPTIPAIRVVSRTYPVGGDT